MAIEGKLAEFAVGARPSPAARAVVRLALFDWAACALAGRDAPLAGVMDAHLAGQGGAGAASVVGRAEPAPARMAALANGAISHALDYDDTHLAHIGHLSVVMVPAALAAAETGGASMRTLQDAVTIGGEAAVRVGLWLGRGHYQAGFHQTATAGAHGAALAAARLLGLDAGGAADALRIAAGMAAGLKSQFGSQGKPLNAGMAAAAGLEAAQLAAAGLRPAAGVLDGPQGLGATHAGEGDMAALEGLGQRWEVERLSFKFHACCHGLHAMLEALDRAAAGVPAGRVAGLRIVAHPRWATVCNQPEPQDGLQCKFSFRHAAAMRLAGIDTAAPVAFDDAGARDPALVALRRRVTVAFDDALAETEARVVLRLEDGTERRAGHDIAGPLPRADLRARLRAKARVLLGAPLAGALWRASATGAGLSGFARLLRGGLQEA